MNPWLSLLKELKLTKSERGVADRFAAHPDSLAFLPVVEILKSHQLSDEAVELLAWGSERHPHYVAAKVLLAKELYAKGMIELAWHKLSSKRERLGDNLLAQGLLLRCALLLGLEASARATYHHLQRLQNTDKELHSLGSLLLIEGMGRARQRLFEDFKARGVVAVLPPQAPAPFGSEAELPLTDWTASHPQTGAKVTTAWVDDKVLAGYHVVPLSEIFQTSETSKLCLPEAGVTEIDTPTLAEIYEAQGHYKKALAVYRRLLKLSPRNDYLRKMVTALAAKEELQKQSDLTVDPALVDQMELLEGMNRKIRFYQDILARLECSPL